MKKKVLLGLFALLILFSITGCSKNTKSFTSSSSKNNNKYDSVKIYDKIIPLNSKETFQKMSFMANKDDLIFRTSGTNAAYVTYEDSTNPNDIIVEYGTTVVNVAVRYYEGKTIENVMSQAPYQRTNKKVGKIEYQYFEYTDNGIKGYCYSYEYEGSTYTITFEAKINISSFVDTFMKNISFN